jgi:hypothetical protein
VSPGVSQGSGHEECRPPCPGVPASLANARAGVMVSEDATLRSASSSVQFISRDGDDLEAVIGQIARQSWTSGDRNNRMAVADNVQSKVRSFGPADEDRLGVELMQRSLAGPVEGPWPIGDGEIVQDGKCCVEVVQARVDKGEPNCGHVEVVHDLRDCGLLRAGSGTGKQAITNEQEVPLALVDMV